MSRLVLTRVSPLLALALALVAVVPLQRTEAGSSDEEARTRGLPVRCEVVTAVDFSRDDLPVADFDRRAVSLGTDAAPAAIELVANFRVLPKKGAAKAVEPMPDGQCLALISLRSVNDEQGKKVGVKAGRYLTVSVARLKNVEEKRAKTLLDGLLWESLRIQPELLLPNAAGQYENERFLGTVTYVRDNEWALVKVGDGTVVFVEPMDAAAAKASAPAAPAARPKKKAADGDGDGDDAGASAQPAPGDIAAHVWIWKAAPEGDEGGAESGE